MRYLFVFGVLLFSLLLPAAVHVTNDASPHDVIGAVQPHATLADVGSILKPLQNDVGRVATSSMQLAEAAEQSHSLAHPMRRLLQAGLKEPLPASPVNWQLAYLARALRHC